MPKVSVIIPTYNREKFIARALDTVLQQTFTDYEIIVVDDGSQDATRQVLGPYMPKIRYFYQENAGISAARNRGIQEAKGQYIAFLDSDDTWAPEKLMLQVSILDGHKKVGLVHSKMTRLDELGRPIGTKPENPTGRNFKELLEIGGDIPTSTVMTRRECFDKVGYFDESLTIMEDFEMWLRISEYYDIHAIDSKNLANYYHHPQQITKDAKEVYANYINMQKKVLDYYDSKPTKLILKRIAESEYVLSRIYFDEKLYQEALSLVFSSIKKCPFVGLLLVHGKDSLPNKTFKLFKPYFYLVVCFLLSILRLSRKPAPQADKKKKPPMVSVIVPVYNRIQYLEEAINSILMQSYTDFEVIIVDDGSTENIKGALIRCVNKAPSKVHFIRQRNRGPGGARNRGIKEAKGKYIAFLDSDNEWETEFLSKTMDQFHSGSYQWLSTASHRLVINDKEECLQDTVIHADPINGIDELYSLLLKTDVLGCPSQVVVEKACFNKTGYFREDLLILEDWEMWLRLAKARFEFCRIPEHLYKYKIRSNSLTKTESLKGLQCAYKVLAAYSKDAIQIDPANRLVYSEKMWDIARHVLNNKKKDYVLFLKSLIKSQWYAPSLERALKSFNSFKRRHTSNPS